MKSSVQSTKKNVIAGRNASPELDSTYFLGVSANLEAETKEYYSNLRKNGGSIKMETLLIVDEYVKELKEFGLFGKILDMGIYCGDNLAAALTKLVYVKEAGPYLENKGFKESDFDEKRGLQGNKVNHLNTKVKMKHTFYCNVSMSTFVYGTSVGPPSYWPGMG